MNIADGVWCSSIWFWIMPRSGIAVSRDRIILSFRRILHCDLLSGNTDLHSFQHWIRFLLSSQSYQHLTSQETSFCMVGRGSLHDSLNNTEYRLNPRLPLKGWRWTPIAEDPAHWGRLQWLELDLTWKSHSCSLASMVPENTRQAAKQERQLNRPNQLQKQMSHDNCQHGNYA